MKLYKWRTVALLACLYAFSGEHCTKLVVADEAAGKVIYQWNPDNFRPAETNPWKGERIVSNDGTSRLSISGTGSGYNNYLYVPPGRLLNGKEYTAIIKYEIVSPTKFPDSFYMFARSKKLGQAQDFWQVWNGDPGDKGIARMAMSLKGTKASDDWAFFVGCKGPGTVIIDSFQIVEGTGLTHIPATAATKPVAFNPTAKLPTVALPTGAQPFVLDAPAPKKGLVLSAADFGLIPDGANGPVSTEVATANFTGIKQALKACREQGASVLKFPQGVYRFYSNESIPVVDLSDLTIDGQGSEFIITKLHNGVEAVSVQRCERVVIKNLKMDWDWSVTPIASLGRVVSATPDGKGYDLTFPDLSETQIEATLKAPWTHFVPTDAVTLTRQKNDRYPVSVEKLEKVDAKTLRVVFKTPVALEVDATYTIRHLYYNFECFKVGFSNNLHFDNVTIYSMPGMGWFCTGDMKNWKLTNCNIKRREGSRNPFTTSADGFHVSQSMGNLSIENCVFTGSGDDSINIHDNCYQGVQRVDDTTLTLINCPPWRLRIQVGDTLELFHSSYRPLGYRSKVKTVVYKDKNTTVTLEDALPANLSPLSIVQNRRYDTNNVRIANCTFEDTSGRSILLSARNATIENNTFKNAVGTAIQLHTEIVGDLWAEGSGASNMVIRGNTFENVSYEGRYDNAVIYSGAKLPVGVTNYPLFHDILIEKNRFINSSGPVVSLYSAKDVIVRDNRIESIKSPQTANYLSGSFFTSNASGIAFRGNTWQKKPEVGETGVFFDATTTTGVVSENNVLVNP
jgi:hypothetical protein